VPAPIGKPSTGFSVINRIVSFLRTTAKGVPGVFAEAASTGVDAGALTVAAVVGAAVADVGAAAVAAAPTAAASAEPAALCAHPAVALNAASIQHALRDSLAIPMPYPSNRSLSTGP